MSDSYPSLLLVVLAKAVQSPDQRLAAKSSKGKQFVYKSIRMFVYWRCLGAWLQTDMISRACLSEPGEFRVNICYVVHR